MPVFDIGFIYSQTVDRLWRKNRQAPPTNSTCYGRDINRNWDSHWSDVGGASSLPCAADYKGQTAADSPEVRALAAFQNEKAASPQGVKLYLDWHSYAQMFFTPYGYTCTGKPEDYDELVDLAKGFVQALQQPYGTEFEYGAVCNTIYKTTGTSNDYTYDVT
jgi:carboxypeptidase A4